MKMQLLSMHGQIMWLQAKTFIKSKTEKITSKMSADDKLVVAMILIAIAAALCYVFRENISKLLNAIFNSVGGTISDTFKGTAGEMDNPFAEGNTGS